MGVFLGDYEVDLNKFLEKHEEKIKISEIQVSQSYVSFIISDIKNAEEIAKQIITQTNKHLLKSIEDRIRIFKDEIILSLSNEKEYKIDDLTRKLEYYKNKK